MLIILIFPPPKTKTVSNTHETKTFKFFSCFEVEILHPPLSMDILILLLTWLLSQSVLSLPVTNRSVQQVVQLGAGGNMWFAFIVPPWQSGHVSWSGRSNVRVSSHGQSTTGSRLKQLPYRWLMEGAAVVKWSPLLSSYCFLYGIFTILLHMLQLA